MASTTFDPLPNKSMSELNRPHMSELGSPFFRCRIHESLHVRIVSLRKQLGYSFDSGSPFPMSELAMIIMSKFPIFSVLLPDINSDIVTFILTNRALEIFRAR
jgi:hypothetical protein